MGEFALLFLLCRAALSLRMPPQRAAVISALFCVGYAITDEWHQTFVPEHGGAWVDVMIDTNGILVALVVSA